MKKFILFSLLITICEFSYAGTCAFYLNSSEKQSEITTTDRFISFISNLIEQGVIGNGYVESLALGQFTNPFTSPMVKSEHAIYGPIFKSYLSADLNKEQIQQWAKATLLEKNRVKQDKEVVNDGTMLPMVKMNFHKIHKQKYRYEDYDFFVEVDEFALMETHVTQWMWAQIKSMAGYDDIKDLNPSKFNDGPESQIIKVKETSLRIRPNNPVEQVSWYDSKRFVGELNQLSKSSISEVQEALRKIIPDHKFGDIYDLPNMLQMRLVISNAGEYDDPWSKSKDPHFFAQYDWFEHNSENSTHPVAERQGRIFDGHTFYDLNGNVFIWSVNTYDGHTQFLKNHGLTTIPIKNVLAYIFFGSSYETSIEITRMTYTSTGFNEPPDFRKSDIGLRLVRYRK